MSNDKDVNLIDKENNSLELSDHISLQVLDDFFIKKEDENNQIKNDTPIDEKASLESMGYPRALIDRIYSVIHPQNIEEALDYLNKNDKDKFTHSYIPNESNLCSICGYKRSDHDIDEFLLNVEKKEEKKEPEIIVDNKTNLLLDEDIDEEDQDIKNMFEKYKNKFNNNYYGGFNFKNSNTKKECGVCMDTIESNDIFKVTISCKHYFCVDCWKEYLKEKINNANVYKLSCMDHECNFILEPKFIKKILDNDNDLLEKYDRFLSRQNLMNSNKKIKFCPFPDCDGYAEKKFSKYVKCNKGHEFCFECLAPPHGMKGCAKIIDKGFEEWKAHTLVKRCPNCKFWTEKNEGCNHMTCSQCKFQWCWVCEKECVAGHYEFGPCKGLHFERVNNDEDAKRLMRDNCDCCCVIGWLITNFIYLLIYLLMMPCFYLAVLGFKYLDEYGNCAVVAFYCMCFLPFFICYEVVSVFYIVVFTIPGFFICPYGRFLKNILFGKILGELFPV